VTLFGAPPNPAEAFEALITGRLPNPSPGDPVSAVFGNREDQPVGGDDHRLPDVQRHGAGADGAAAGRRASARAPEAQGQPAGGWWRVRPRPPTRRLASDLQKQLRERWPARIRVHLIPATVRRTLDLRGRGAALEVYAGGKLDLQLAMDLRGALR